MVLSRSIRSAGVLGLLVASHATPLPQGLVVVPASAWAQPGEPKQQFEARPIPGPPLRLPSPRAHAVNTSPSHLGRAYSATPRGLFASDDRGQSWTPLAVDGTYQEVFSLAVHPTDPGLVLVGRRDGLWQTHDGGRSWIPLPYPPAGPAIPLAIARAESQPHVIYMATARGGVFKSIDNGYRWADASKGLPEAMAGGRPAEIRSLVVHPRNPEIAYIAHERHAVYRTTDGGANWHVFNQGLPFPVGRPTYPPRLAFDPDDPSRLYLAFAQPVHSRLTRNRLYVSSAIGEWFPVEVDLPANTPFIGLTVDQRTRALHFWAEDSVWELPLPVKGAPSP